jgi:hypothetical protein
VRPPPYPIDYSSCFQHQASGTTARWWLAKSSAFVCLTGPYGGACDPQASGSSRVSALATTMRVVLYQQSDGNEVSQLVAEQDMDLSPTREASAKNLLYCEYSVGRLLTMATSRINFLARTCLLSDHPSAATFPRGRAEYPSHDTCRSGKTSTEQRVCVRQVHPALTRAASLFMPWASSGLPCNGRPTARHSVPRRQCAWPLLYTPSSTYVKGTLAPTRFSP